MIGSFIFSHQRGNRRLVLDGCRQAVSGPVRITLIGRLFSWASAKPDIEADLAALARRIEVSGIPAALDDVDGEWCLIVEDGRDGTVAFVSDHIGTHPIFLAEGPDGIIAASHLPRLVKEARLGLDEERVAIYLSRGKKDLLQPLFAGARRLGACRVFTVDASGAARERTWMEWDTHEKRTPDFEVLKDTILGAIWRETDSLPRPIGGTLSAGLDSSVLSVALKDTPDFCAYSIDAGPDVDNEMAEIDETVRLTGMKHRYVPATFGVGELQALVEACGEPIRELKSLSTMHSCVARAQADGKRSFLLGLGPDMIFAGAQMLALPYIHGLVCSGRLGDVWRAAAGLAPYLDTSRFGVLALYLRAAAKAQRHGGALRLPGRADSASHLKPGFVRSNPLRRPFDVKKFIVQMLSNVAISPSVRGLETLTGLEVVAPLYSRRVANYTLSCDVRHFMRNGNSKAMMRKALETVLPHHVAWAKVKKKVPHRSVASLVFAPESAASIRAAVGESSVLRRMLAQDPVADFERCNEAGRDAEFWVRCLQVAYLERLAGLQ